MEVKGKLKIDMYSMVLFILILKIYKIVLYIIMDIDVCGKSINIWMGVINIRFFFGEGGRKGGSIGGGSLVLVVFYWKEEGIWGECGKMLIFV